MSALLVVTVVSTALRDDTAWSHACTVVQPCVGVVRQKFLGGEFLTYARPLGSAASHLRISGTDLSKIARDESLSSNGRPRPAIS
jgi:hypothetical protein